jgi:Ca2+-binding RTX toxin-like protein
VAYNAVGTSGNDTLNRSGDTGPGNILGLAGDDSILTGSGLVDVAADSGNDIIILQTGNTGTVHGGTGSDSIWDVMRPIGSMVLFGDDGADSININAATPQTIVGGNDATDGSDSIRTGGGADIVFGNGGDDTINGFAGDDTLIGGIGNDCLYDGISSDLVFANEGNDTISVYAGNDTVYAGQGNDSAIVSPLGPNAGTPFYYMNEGNDTLLGAASVFAMTVVGGNDSLDGNDDLYTGSGNDLVFGNGGNDEINAGNGANTVVGGYGTDNVLGGGGGDLILGNESNDTINGGGGTGNDTVFAGLGDDTVFTGGGRDTIAGNEGNDTIRGYRNVDTISGGSGSDVFVYRQSEEDGDNAAAGSVEFITDLNWADDRFQTSLLMDVAGDVGAVNASTLALAATVAISSLALGGGLGGRQAAAQFTFGGRTYLAINQDTGVNRLTFDDAYDILLDVTGAIGTISTSNFV